jgi:hypothetical protein
MISFRITARPHHYPVEQGCQLIFSLAIMHQCERKKLFSSGIEILMSDTFAKINPTDPLI